VLYARNNAHFVPDNKYFDGIFLPLLTIKTGFTDYRSVLNGYVTQKSYTASYHNKACHQIQLGEGGEKKQVYTRTCMNTVQFQH